MRNKLLVLITIALFTACGLFDSTTPDAAVEQTACYTRAVLPLVADLASAQALVKELQRGSLTLEEAFDFSRASAGTVYRVRKALDACTPKPAAPVADAGAAS